MTLHRFDVKMIKTTQNYQSDQMTMNCMHFRIGKNVEFCHKTFKTTQNSKSDQSTMTLHRFDVKMIKTTQNYQSDQITMNCIDLTSNWQKCRVLSQNIQNNAKLQKWSKYNDFASIWCQNDQNNAKLPKRSNYDELHDLTSNWQKCRVLSQNIQNNAKLQKWSKYNDLNRFDVELAKMSSFVTKHFASKQRHKTFKTTQNSKSDQNTMTLHRFDVKMIKTTQNYQIDQITMNCMDLTSNWQKCRVLSQNIQNNAKLQKWSKYNDFASIWCQNDQNNAKLPKRSNYDELHEFDVELAKMSSFVTKHSIQRKTPKVIKIQWLESIWCRIVEKNVEFCHKTFKTTQNSKSDQNTMTWIDLMSNWQKCRVLSQNIQNNAKLQKWSKYNDFASIWCQNDQNNAKLPKRSNDDELHAFDVELAKMSSFVTKHSKQRKTPKVIKVQWLCIDLMSKWSKQRKTTKAIKLRWIACIWRRIGKNVEFCHKTFKTTQNSKSDQNTMTWIDSMSNCQKCRVLSQNIQKRKTPKVIKLQWLCIDLMSNWQKCRVLSQNIQNNAKLQKWSKHNDFASIWCQNDQNNAKLPNRSNYDELHGFDVELAKMSSFVTKHSKQRKTPKVIKVQWLCIDLMSKWSKQRKTTKLIKLRWIAWIWRRISKNVEFCHKTFKTP